MGARVRCSRTCSASAGSSSSSRPGTATASGPDTGRGDISRSSSACWSLGGRGGDLRAPRRHRAARSTSWRRSRSAEGTSIALLMARSARFRADRSIATLRNARGGQRRPRCCRPRPSASASTRQGVQAELKLLQAQVEPHFLFNTLANLRHLVQTELARRAGDARPPDPLPAHGAARDPRRELDARARGRARARLPRDPAHPHGRRAGDRDRRARRSSRARRSRR